MPQPSIENLEFLFLGQSYKIRCPKENQVLLEMAAEKLQQQLDNLVNKGTPFEKQAIMAGLLLAFDLLRKSTDVTQALEEMNDIRNELLKLNLTEDSYPQDEQKNKQEIETPPSSPEMPAN